ncbi:hypothetical protein FRB99_007208 [Tulasnella sp. 403]|nr:hypothetical protein FRB99_007208 [Tulasnella sp. 403]
MALVCSQVDAGAFSFQAHQAAQCSPRKLGYTIDPTLERILSSINADDLVDVIQKGLTVVLVLHPIACGLAGLAFIFAAWAMLSSKSGRLPSTLATVNGFIAATLTTIVFIIDCVLVGIARSRIRSKTSGLATISYGNAVWMTLGTQCCQVLGVVSLLAQHFERRWTNTFHDIDSIIIDAPLCFSYTMKPSGMAVTDCLHFRLQVYVIPPPNVLLYDPIIGIPAQSMDLHAASYTLWYREQRRRLLFLIVAATS